ncbi:helix-turn-helix transcriptional regulator [Hymenobacter terricola]|uniref:helix-turn-helix transcriptional regulator n=1 Tax=Hymenobacter terricola TaxID=2819236 RepID=UPI001B30B8BE|nr:helix-turn-helix transcriptional regulator [Hymenobacter terricola]
MAAPVPVPIDQRFAQLIQQFGLTKNSFAISLGKTASVVQHLIDGRNKPGYDLLCRVFEIYPNVSRDWLLLGRGPMLVSGEPAPKPTVPSIAPLAAPSASELPLEPIDLADVELPMHRRPGPGVAGTRLQPAEIAATLALAAAAAQPVGTSTPAPEEATRMTTASAPETSSETALPVIESVPQAAALMAAPPAPEPVPAPTTPTPAAVAPPVPVAVAAPENYVAAALNAQYLQHQLAMAELRNQHLLEQQQMLREMLAMARQAMV